MSAAVTSSTTTILPAALVARPPASLLLVVTIVAPEARGLVARHGHCVFEKFVEGLKGSVGDDVAVGIAVGSAGTEA
jgi:hypothetical protein